MSVKMLKYVFHGAILIGCCALLAGVLYAHLALQRISTQMVWIGALACSAGIAVEAIALTATYRGVFARPHELTGGQSLIAALSSLAMGLSALWYSLLKSGALRLLLLLCSGFFLMGAAVIVLRRRSS